MVIPLASENYGKMLNLVSASAGALFAKQPSRLGDVSLQENLGADQIESKSTLKGERANNAQKIAVEKKN